MIEAIQRHPKRALVVIFFLIFIVIVIAISNLAQTFFGINIISIINSDEVQQILIFGISLDNWCTLLTMFGVLIGAGWGLMQYDRNTKLRQQEKASEIAQDFANNLIEKTALISDTLMSNKEFQKMIAKIVKSKKLNQFTYWEIIDILGDKQCFNKCEQIIRSKRTQQKYTQLLETKYNETERTRFNSNFSILVETTLNHIEAVCINISSKAAGSQFIYDSLHQSFLNIIEILSIKISKRNYNNVDKYFINVIDVYNMWNKQKNKDIQKFNKTQAKIDKLNHRVSLEVNKLLSKKSKTV